MMKKRNISTEMLGAIDDLKKHREGKITLKTYKIEETKSPTITPDDIVHIREKFNMSRPVFARKLKMSPRSLERWEQGISKPNRQAIILLVLTEKYPETLDKVSSL